MIPARAVVEACHTGHIPGCMDCLACANRHIAALLAAKRETWREASEVVKKVGYESNLTQRQIDRIAAALAQRGEG